VDLLGRGGCVFWVLLVGVEDFSMMTMDGVMGFRW
jgi:hypothetical protein